MATTSSSSAKEQLIARVFSIEVVAMRCKWQYSSIMIKDGLMRRPKQLCRAARRRGAYQHGRRP